MRTVQSGRRAALQAALAAVLLAGASPAAAGQAERVEVADAHALVSPMHAGGGVFMTLTNTGRRAATITGAAAPVADTVALHRCQRPQGMQPGQGRRAERPDTAAGPLTIPAGETVTLRRGGRHLCMTGTNARFKLDAVFPLTLTFQDGSTKTVRLKIEGVAKPRRGTMQGQGGQP